MRTKRNFSFFILHFSFLLLAFLLMGTSCKKDRKTWYTSTFKGVAVDYFDGTPIAGLRVALVKKYKIREMYPDIPVYEFDTLEVTTSDQSGEFKFKCRTQQNEFYADDNAGKKYYTPVEYYVVFTGNETYFAQSYKINNPGKWHQKKEIGVKPYIRFCVRAKCSILLDTPVSFALNVESQLSCTQPQSYFHSDFHGITGVKLDTSVCLFVPFCDQIHYTTEIHNPSEYWVRYAGHFDTFSPTKNEFYYEINY